MEVRVKIDKNKITVGMIRRLSSGSIDAVTDLIAALLVDEHGIKIPREQALPMIEDMTLADLEQVIEQLTETVTPKAS